MGQPAPLPANRERQKHVSRERIVAAHLQHPEAGRGGKTKDILLRVSVGGVMS
jgi:hypothetical protein